MNALAERKHPLVWEIEGVKRILDPQMPRPDQVLTLLYSSTGWIPESDLRSWVEYKNSTHFRKVVLTPLHKSRMIEYQRREQRARITPRGVKEVEDRILPK